MVLDHATRKPSSRGGQGTVHVRVWRRDQSVRRLIYYAQLTPVEVVKADELRGIAAVEHPTPDSRRERPVHLSSLSRISMISTTFMPVVLIMLVFSGRPRQMDAEVRPVIVAGTGDIRRNVTTASSM